MDMTNAELFKKTFGIYATELWAWTEKEFLEWLNADVPEKNVGDTISRQEAIDSARQGICDFFGLNADDFKFPITNTDYLAWALNKNVTARVNSLPSAQRKTGNWIDKPVYIQTWDGKTWDGCTYCSECKEMHEYGYRSNFCPRCGAEMREKEKEYESE